LRGVWRVFHMVVCAAFGMICRVEHAAQMTVSIGQESYPYARHPLRGLTRSAVIFRSIPGFLWTEIRFT